MKVKSRDKNQRWRDLLADNGKASVTDIEIRSITENLVASLNKTLSHYPEFAHAGKRKRIPASFMRQYISAMPGKLRTLGLFARQFKEFAGTCIITDREIESLVSYDSRLFGGILSKNTLLELNYLIPAELKKTGYELFRKEEDSVISGLVINKLAKAIHSRYLREVRNRQRQTGGEVFYEMDFSNLPDEIRFSNLDNARHITTKLLAVGYRIRPVEKGHSPVTLRLKEEEVEIMAKMEHLRWSWDKRLNGWMYGNTRDEKLKTHPGLIPYEQLSESEKEKDRELVRMIPPLLQDIGYIAYPVADETIKDLSYIVKPGSSINRLLKEIHRLNDGFGEALNPFPGMKVRVDEINRKIDEIIREVEGNYNYARHIQKTYLPEELFIRECFPESFVLFLPKDIVSGDFYYFRKTDDVIIFAAADCTGHGIPGAILSTISYRITDQAAELKSHDPAEMLNYIYSKLHKFLRKDDPFTGLPDDMDIALCTFEQKTGILRYSCVMNPLYIVSGENLTEIRPGNSTDRNSDSCFVSETAELKPGDSVFIFTDGFTDQFGGSHHKKFTSTRFRELLMRINKLPMAEQKDILYQEITGWREVNDEDQTDDILVIGIRI